MLTLCISSERLPLRTGVKPVVRVQCVCAFVLCEKSDRRTFPPRGPAGTRGEDGAVRVHQRPPRACVVAINRAWGRRGTFILLRPRRLGLQAKTRPLREECERACAGAQGGGIHRTPRPPRARRLGELGDRATKSGGPDSPSAFSGLCKKCRRPVFHSTSFPPTSFNFHVSAQWPAGGRGTGVGQLGRRPRGPSRLVSPPCQKCRQTPILKHTTFPPMYFTSRGTRSGAVPSA